MFDDVKKRETHFHVRCPQCAELTQRLHKACESNKDRVLYDKLLKAHHLEVKRWRQKETLVQTQAKSSPDQVIVLSFDDTSAMCFPRTTNRPIKNLPKDKVKMTPFNLTNHGTGENIYIYNLTGKWKKGADRLCTILYHVLLRIKWKAPDGSSQEDLDLTKVELDQRHGRKLIFLADNASENKNNCLFQFCSELILRKWFDEIELLFGPVGHTHNGNDAVHYIHNQIAGNYCSITPAELFINYKHAWHSERTRPQPVIMETQYDWCERYQPLSNSVTGFTKTTQDPDYVRAFRFSWADGIVVMHIKGSPVSSIWHGVNSVPNGPGFVCLRGIPVAYPLPKEPTDFKIKSKYVNRLNSESVKKYCRDNDRGPMHDHLMQMARDLIVPSQLLTEVEERKAAPHIRKSRSGYGVIERIGVQDCVVFDVPFIRARPHVQNETAFWNLPPDLCPDVPRAPGLAPTSLVVAPVPVPLVRYAAKRPTGPARAPTKTGKSKRRKQSQRQSSSDESPDYSSEEPEEPEEPNWAEKGVPESWPDLSSPLTVGAFVVTEDEFIVRKRTRYGISVCKVHTPSSAPPLLSSSAPQFFFLFFFFLVSLFPIGCRA